MPPVSDTIRRWALSTAVASGASSGACVSLTADSHVSEPACAVRAAVGEGSLVSERYEVYLRIRQSLDG